MPCGQKVLILIFSSLQNKTRVSAGCLKPSMKYKIVQRKYQKDQTIYLLPAASSHFRFCLLSITKDTCMLDTGSCIIKYHIRYCSFNVHIKEKNINQSCLSMVFDFRLLLLTTIYNSHNNRQTGSRKQQPKISKVFPYLNINMGWLLAICRI